MILITYDLNRPGKDYTKLYEEIKNLGTWWHYLDSVWVVDTTLSPQQVWARLTPAIDQNDSVFVVRIKNDQRYSGWLKQEAWDWLNAKVF